jgi:hypothetical protein
MNSDAKEVQRRECELPGNELKCPPIHEGDRD